MGYVGNQTSNSYSSMDKQTITGDGTPNYTLTHAVANAQEIEVFVNNVRQEAGVAYTVAGTALSMTGNVASTDDFYVIYQGKALQTVVPPDGSVSTGKLANGAVTSAKLASGAAASNLGTSVNLATIKDSTGTNTAMTIDSTGRILTPARPAFSATASTSFNITSGTIPYDTEQFDIGGNYNASTYKFTCPVAGIYSFSFSYYAVLATTARGSLYKNTSLYAIGNRVESNGNHPSTTSTIVMQCSVNDEIYIGWQEGNVHIAPAYNHFSGYLIG